MFSVLFPGQGSQSPGMAKIFYENFDYVKSLFQEADDLLKNSISKLVLEGPKEKLDLTENTQPAIFLVCLLYTSPSPRDRTRSRMPSSA